MNRPLQISAMFPVALALLGGGLTTIARAADASDQQTFSIDVVMDNGSVRFTRADAADTGPARGDTFVASGKLFPGNMVPDGDTSGTFGPDAVGSLGSVLIRGYYIADAADIASGAATDYTATTHVLIFDDGSSLVTEGLEGSAPEVRAVIGGTGRLGGAIGQVTEVVLGNNASGGVNLRLTFSIRAMNAQATDTQTERAQHRKR
jgi:hypothetical protein